MDQVIPDFPQSTPPRLGAPGQDPLIAYEERMNRDPRWAMSEASEFFEGKGSVQTALRKITARLHALGIPYAVVGGMALFSHGFRRFTEDVDLLVTRAGLKKIHDELEGLGYVPPFAKSKNLRDVENGVKIEFLVTGDYPGDGKPKPVAFPDPADVGVSKDGITYLNLPKLIELKLASGMTNVDRLKDLADVQELIKVLNLPAQLEQELHPFVRSEYARLWNDTRRRSKRFVLHRSVNAALKDRSTDSLQPEFDELKAMQADGVTVEKHGNEVRLVTTDPDVARKYHMMDETEIMDEQ